MGTKLERDDQGERRASISAPSAGNDPAVNSGTLIPLATFRWLRPSNRDPLTLAEPMGRLQQAFRRPGADILIWQDIPVVSEAGSAAHDMATWSWK